MERAFEEGGKALDAGDLVGIFPEGKITADGSIHPFRRCVFSKIELAVGAAVPAAEALPERLQSDAAALRGELA
ncbi:MAG: 1-acyl-sn-glycerol-3-phosphate acyltransferase [Sulfuritalea sp.]|nr:1-acyl-sn-glycerol-3-phosphate acyltransferase [Sulfuritalea sp.]